MGATEDAKQRSSSLRRKGSRPVSPQERADVNLDPGAVQGAPMPAGGQIWPEPNTSSPGVPQQSPPAGLQADTPMDRPHPRTSGEVNADLEAYSEALAQANKGDEPDEPKKKDSKDVDDSGFEETFWESDKLNNSTRRKRITSRCAKMELEDYIMNGGVKQKVPIVPGKIEPTFTSASVDEDLEVKRMMFGVQGTDVYIANRFSLMQLTLSLYAFNGEPLPSHLNVDGAFDEDLFNTKFAKVRKYPTQLAEDLVNNWLWFDERVKDLFEEDLGNG